MACPRMCILRMVDHSSPESRKDCASAVAGFLSDMESPPSVHNKVACDLHKRREKAGIPKCIVPWDFDKTPSGTLHKLGQLVANHQVVQVIKKTYSNVGVDWATFNPRLSELFFDSPYPGVAITELGYSPVELV